MNFRGACVKPKFFFFCILERVDGVNGEISINNESERSMQVKA